MKLIASSLSFLTSISIDGDLEELRRNLWFLPFAGLIIGAVIAVPLYIGERLGFNAGILGIVVYVLIEGAKNIQGIGKLGDAAFAEDEEKKSIVRQRTFTSGGVIFATTYMILLFLTFFQANFLSIISSQVVAKYAMLYVLVTSKASWKGKGYYLMLGAKTRDLIPGIVALLPFVILSPMPFIPSLIVTFIVVHLIRNYAHNVLSGVDENLLYAANSIAFLTSLILQAGIPPSISYPL